MSANIKLIVANIPGQGECVGLCTTERELFLTPEKLIDLVDALINLGEVIAERKQRNTAPKRPALRVVGGSHVH